MKFRDITSEFLKFTVLIRLVLKLLTSRAAFSARFCCRSLGNCLRLQIFIKFNSKLMEKWQFSSTHHPISDSSMAMVELAVAVPFQQSMAISADSSNTKPTCFVRLNTEESLPSPSFPTIPVKVKSHFENCQQFNGQCKMRKSGEDKKNMNKSTGQMQITIKHHSKPFYSYIYNDDEAYLHVEPKKKP